MPTVNFTAAKTEVIWSPDGTVRVLVMLNDPAGNQRGAHILNIDLATGIVTNALGVSVGTLTAGQRTALTNVGNGLDNLVAAADAAGKIPF
jgi:hypothetical protein